MEKVVRLVEKERVTSAESALERLVRIASQSDKLEKLAPEEKTSPVVLIVDLLIEEAVNKRASDIHVEPHEDGVLVRNRIDGILKNRYLLPKNLQAPLISRIKIMANMDISEKRLPQDGRIKANMSSKRLDLRISTVPSLYGEKAVLRILDVEATSIPLTGIGFSQEIFDNMVSLILKAQGVFFITGPTGSGKTSTLYACISHVKSSDINIVTLEDPIEYEMKGVTQIAIHEKIGLTFAEVLRSVLRQDPDVIMVGEMRDTETARIAMQASLTGHLVFSTLHTSDAIAAPARLTDMGVPSYLIASSLSAVLAQRLVRVICPNCKEPYRPSAEELIPFGLFSEADLSTLYAGRGCEQCDFTGYYGRTAISELLVLDDEIRAMINSGAPESAFREKAKAMGMKRLIDDGLRKLQEGMTTAREILRVTSGLR